MSSSDATEVAPDEVATPDELRDGLLARLTELCGDAVIASHILPGKDIWVRVRNDAWAEVASTIRLVMGALYFGFVSAIDWMPSPFGRSMDAEVDKIVHGHVPKNVGEQTTGFAGGDTRFQVVCRVANIREHWGITLKADVADDAPSIGTLTKVYAGADWHEREAWEMFGIDFVGHPALRKLYLPGDFEGHPMRKDFPLLARIVKPWPGIVDVEPMPGAGSSDESAEAAEAAEGGEA